MMLRAFVALTFVVILSGCFDPCQRGFLVGLEWEEPGLYEEFPEEGNYDGISVTWRTHEEGWQIESKYAQRFPGNPSISVNVRETDVVTVSFSYENAVSKEEFYRDLNETFAILGFGPPIPALEGWTPEFSRDLC